MSGISKVCGDSLASESDSTSSKENSSNRRKNIEDIIGASEGRSGTPKNMEADPTNIKFVYRASTWSKEHSTFDPEPREFRREDSGTSDEYLNVSTFMCLFRKF